MIYRMNPNWQITPTRQAAINGLAVVGFIALVAAGIWLAIYSTRFVPVVVNGVGGAAVYIGSIFVPSKEPPSLSVIPNSISTTTISFDTESADVTTAISKISPEPVTPVKSTPVATTPGNATSETYQISGATTTSSLSGFPDLVTNITAIGYLATSSAESFIASSTVPSGSRPAVKFTIKNIGNNVTGQWRFSASIPTQTSYLYYSPFQQQLNPGESIDYTLGFDQANRGSSQTVFISANFDRAVTESNFNNNGASVNLTIIGG
jgi:hypothetical protein